MTTATQAETVRDSKDNMEGVRSMVKTMSTKAATKEQKWRGQTMSKDDGDS